MDPAALPDAENKLDIYILDYLMKKKLFNTARTFLEERNVDTNVEIIEAPQGLLYDWRSIFEDSSSGTINENQSQAASPCQEENSREQQRQLDMNRQFMHAQEQVRQTGVLLADLHRSPNAILDDEIHRGYTGNPSQMHSRLSSQVPGTGRIHSPISAIYNSRPFGQGNPLNIEAQRHTQERNQQLARNFLMDPSLCNQGVMQMSYGLATDGNPAQMHSQQSSQVRGAVRIRLQISAIYYSRSFGQGNPLNIAALHMQQQNQQPARNFPVDPSLYNQDVMQMRYGSAVGGIHEIATATLPDQHLVNHQQLVQPEAAQQENILGANHSNANHKRVRRLCAHSLEAAQGTDDLIRASSVPDDGVKSGHDDHEKKGVNSQTILTLSGTGKKLVCCDFSSDGKLLAGAGHENTVRFAGHENTVFLWNTDNSSHKSTWEAHSGLMTDIRFRPNTSTLATSSSDKTVQLWKASQMISPLRTFVGHGSQVASVDFHPTVTELLCSSDNNGKIIFWGVGNSNPKHISKFTGRGKLRFQPYGAWLASAAEDIVNIIDVKREKIVHSLKGDSKNNIIQSVCWNSNSRQLATVTEDCVKVWSINGHCIRELRANHNPFRCCTFFPDHPEGLAIGGYQTLTLWDFVHNRTMSVEAHADHIAGLEKCQAKCLVASASHDRTIKTWRYIW